MADATDLKSVDPKGSCGFESRHRYIYILFGINILGLGFESFLNVLGRQRMRGR
jgi:hypothetical protein